MNTKFDTGDKVIVTATIKTARTYNGKIYYEVKETGDLIPEEICKLNAPDALVNRGIEEMIDEKLKALTDKLKSSFGVHTLE